MNRDDLIGALTHDNVIAFKYVIREGESSLDDDTAYRILNGGELFNPPPWEHPNRVGKGGSSTAAGAYQAVYGSWMDEKRRYGFEDFAPHNQDQFYVARLVYRGALEDVIAGRVDAAIRKLVKEWDCFSRPQFFAKVPALFEKHGGKAGAKDYPIAQPVPVTPPTEAEVTMAPFLGYLISAAISAAPDLVRLIGNGERSQKNAAVLDKVAQVAMQVTGAVNEQDAAQKLQDAQTAEQFRQAVRDNFDQWLAMTIKFREMDEVSIDKAREFNVAAGRWPILGKLTFIEVLSLIFVAIASIGGGYVLQGNFTDEIKGAVITLMLIGGYTGVKEFWFGSSRGSMVKETK